MAGIISLLDETMLAAAYRGVSAERGPYAPSLKFDYPVKALLEPAKAGPHDDAEDVPIWHYQAPTIEEGGKVRIMDLKCRVRSMDYMFMKVCDSIEWGPVSFSCEDFVGEVDLPLEDRYLVRSPFLSEGTIQGRDKFWKVRAKTDKSFEFVFVYEFPTNSTPSKPNPISGKDLLHDCSFVGPHFVSLFDQYAAQSSTLRVAPLRIVVVVTLMCCKEADYGLLRAGRFYPMIMVLANRELQTATGKVTLARPSKTSMKSMGGETMNAPVGAVLFTDNNSDKLIPDFRWDQTFDYYHLNPRVGDTYVFAHPQKDKPELVIPNAVVSRNMILVSSDYSLFGQEPSRIEVPPKCRNVKKMVGQGEFDNIHLAPTMFLSKEDLVCLSDIPKDALEGFNEITMAPFCIHDCLHMHVRWSAGISDKTSEILIGKGGAAPSYGWRDDDTPNAVAGLPLVPANQKITLELLTLSSFKYTAEARKVRPGKWQIMMHHGASYALDTRWVDWLFRQVGPESGVSSPSDKWAIYYWNLRWVVGKDGKQHERLSWAKEMLEKLRGVDPLSQQTMKRAASSH